MANPIKTKATKNMAPPKRTPAPKRDESRTALLARSIATVDLDVDGRILGANEAFLDIVGREESDIAQRALAAFFCPVFAQGPLANAAISAFQKALAGTASAPAVVHLTAPGGGVRVVQLSYVAIGTGRARRVVGQGVDVTELASQRNKAQAELDDFDARNDLVFRAAEGAYWHSKLTYPFGDPRNEVWASSEFCRILGVSNNDAGAALAGLTGRLPAESSAELLKQFEAHTNDRSGRTGFAVEHPFRMENGEYRWYRSVLTTRRDANGTPIAQAGVLEDIHERKLAALELERTLARFELINQASSVGLWDMVVIAGDPVNPKNEFWWSQQLRTMLGFESERDFPNVLESWSSRLHPDHAERVLTAFAAHLNDHSGRTPYDIQYLLQLKNGTYRWFRATGATSRDAKGVPLRVAGALKDIDEEKRTALDLERALSRADLINKASNVGLWDMVVVAGDPVNAKNEFWWSDQFRKMLGFESERDFPNVLEAWSTRIHPEESDRVLTAFAGHLTDHSGKTPYDIEYRLKLRTGEYRWFRATGSTTRDAQGIPLRVAGALKEINDEKETALALENLVAAAVSGDLTQRIATDKMSGMSKTIGDKMNALLESVADSFRTVKIAIEQVGQASSQLRATSQMMSQSSLELNEGVDRSSSELSRVADGVRANAANASMANQLVTQTSVAGKSGEDRMEEMSTAMGAINSASAQIARIIKVIDEIAFQTNLLALNAAVEAARAGRHGKGFAVVAQEVRNLAERSARAAKETAELIEDSTAKVGDGVRIADGTRSALREIVGNVTKVVDLAGEIATASGEQSTALASVSTSMKQATAAAQAGSQQSNEVAAASDELSRQMKVLNDQMAKYRLGTRATPNLVGLPAGATPELIDQILASIRNNAGFARVEPRAQNVEPLFREERELKATGTDPRSVIPLDRDERGFGQF